MSVETLHRHGSTGRVEYLSNAIVQIVGVVDSAFVGWTSRSSKPDEDRPIKRIIGNGCNFSATDSETLSGSNIPAEINGAEFSDLLKTQELVDETSRTSKDVRILSSLALREQTRAPQSRRA
ncbi:MAG TPA: hypothetical protein VFM05_12325 [Candidatus Saccharimonadales bacterium]|nr:hypothetical protein [Candidatus Saccharimonadales bacterium]